MSVEIISLYENEIINNEENFYNFYLFWDHYLVIKK